MVESILKKNNDKLSSVTEKRGKMMENNPTNFDLNFDFCSCEFFLKKSGICVELTEILCKKEKIDGKSLLSLSESDIIYLRDKYGLKLGDVKKLTILINKIKHENYANLVFLNLVDPLQQRLPANINKNAMISNFLNSSPYAQHQASLQHSDTNLELQNISPPNSVDGRCSTKPELFKTLVSLGKFF